MKATKYFTENVLFKRPELKIEWVNEAIENPEHKEIQENGRIRYWKYIDEFEHYLRVITLPDGETVLNAFFDRNYKRLKKK